MSGPFYHQRSSNSSRSSLPTMQAMPIITQYSDAYNPGALPRGPLRVPQKHPRRNTGPSSYPPPYVSPEPSTTTDKAPPSRDVTVESDRVVASPASPAAESISRGEERGWVPQRKRSFRFLVLFGVIAAIIVGLAVGLSVGLRKTNRTSGSYSDSDDTDHVFPAGSFALKANLAKTVTDCTSRASTWSCEPFGNDALTALRLDINSHGSAAYSVSAKETALTPALSNMGVELVDGSQPTERLIFSAPINKTVLPADATSPANRVAKCQYENVVVRITLYTRQRDWRSVSPPKCGASYPDWPGGIEIAQLINSTISQPTFEDNTGTQIADVQAAQGSCMCSYSNQD